MRGPVPLAADRPAACFQGLEQQAGLGGADGKLRDADREAGRVLDPHVLDVDAGLAGRLEQAGQFAGLVGDDHLDHRELAGRAAVLAGNPGDDPEKGVAALLDRGRAGVARIPGKHGGAAREFSVVQVVIPDQPGELARLFDATGRAGVNIEDVRIEHSPGLPVGVAELSVRPAEAGVLLEALEAGGWPVRR